MSPSPPLPRASWKVPTSLLLLSLVPVLAGAIRLWGLAMGGEITSANARFMTMPVPVVLHIVSATLFCVLGAFQFDAATRQRFPRWHRINGRVVAPSGIVAALTGLWMTAGYAIPAELQDKLLFELRMAAGLAMSLGIVASVRAVMQRRVTDHKAWMLRAYALGQGAGTQVLILLPVTLIFGAPTCLLRDVLMASAWALNVVFAEWLIRRRPPSA
jgi:uncharacterized membrane protein YozB (DUF420 family)